MEGSQHVVHPSISPNESTHPSSQLMNTPSAPHGVKYANIPPFVQPTSQFIPPSPVSYYDSHSQVPVEAYNDPRVYATVHERQPLATPATVASQSSLSYTPSAHEVSHSQYPALSHAHTSFSTLETSHNQQQTIAYSPYPTHSAETPSNFSLSPLSGTSSLSRVVDHPSRAYFTQSTSAARHPVQTNLHIFDHIQPPQVLPIGGRWRDDGRSSMEEDFFLQPSQGDVESQSYAFVGPSGGSIDQNAPPFPRKRPTSRSLDTTAGVGPSVAASSSVIPIIPPTITATRSSPNTRLQGPLRSFEPRPRGYSPSFNAAAGPSAILAGSPLSSALAHSPEYSRKAFADSSSPVSAGPSFEKSAKHKAATAKNVRDRKKGRKDKIMKSLGKRPTIKEHEFLDTVEHAVKDRQDLKTETENLRSRIRQLENQLRNAEHMLNRHNIRMR
ncbi:hypothetical protein OF83DRAFT_1173060 [Amylostereum chailletii]|nr:hypothetical protein OF83DRAFT_1173060 [Amylostereum chailletii]